MTNVQLVEKGFEILVREFGAAGALRFIQQFERGEGNYTKDRWNWLGEQSVDTLYEQVLARRGELV